MESHRTVEPYVPAEGSVWRSSDHRNARAPYLVVTSTNHRGVECRRYRDPDLTGWAGTVFVQWPAWRTSCEPVGVVDAAVPAPEVAP